MTLIFEWRSKNGSVCQWNLFRNLRTWDYRSHFVLRKFEKYLSQNVELQLSKPIQTKLWIVDFITLDLVLTFAIVSLSQIILYRHGHWFQHFRQFKLSPRIRSEFRCSIRSVRLGLGLGYWYRYSGSDELMKLFKLKIKMVDWMRLFDFHSWFLLHFRQLVEIWG